MRINREDSTDLAFAMWCLGGALDFDEFKEWVCLLIETEDDLPYFVYDILDCPSAEDFRGDWRLFGFQPHCELSNLEIRALEGISARRGRGVNLDVASADVGEAALIRAPHIEVRFRAQFPFIQW